MPRRIRRYINRQMTIPIAPICGLAVPLLGEMNNIQAGKYDLVASNLAWKFSGYNITTNSWDLQGLKYGLLPLIGGMLVHKFVGGKPIGANAMLARAGVPFIRI